MNSERALLTAFVLAAAFAGAEERVTRPYQGVTHVHHTDGAQDYHLLRLKPRAMEVVGTEPDQAWSVVSEFAKKVGAQIAINANFFSKTESCGITAGGGRMWSSVSAGCPMTIAFFGNGKASIYDAKAPKPSGEVPVDGLVAAVSGRPNLLAAGKITPSAEPFAAVRHPRTALGLRKDGTLIILIADGRREHALGLTGPEMSEIFLREKTWDAINLDGGGSTTLFIEAEGGIQNRPADGHERVVVNQLGFRLRKRGKP
jgi:exopolysaccharide biosynthesis protein